MILPITVALGLEGSFSRKSKSICFCSLAIRVVKLQCKRKHLVVESVRKKATVGALVLVLNQDRFVFVLNVKKGIGYV